ncbi:polysaccharide biosynthesis/export family protein [Sphingobium algorifonticola]|nr:polysaccharide biosynthesis/export family protein [Sphingobium algorifonticola]
MAAAVLSLPGCAVMSAAGPSSGDIREANQAPVGNANIRIVDLNDALSRTIIARSRPLLLSESIGDGFVLGSMVGKGDVLDISIWEAPPAALFGASMSGGRLASSGAAAQGSGFPEQMVSSEGTITIPFAGKVMAAGRTPQQIENDIVSRLRGKAHLPQVVVRLVRNSAANVTIVGEVANSSRVPLTAKGERLLDILATAGGVRQPVGKTTIQVTRGDRVASLPLDTIIRDPRQNIRLQPDDVVTALFQPYSFVALGATGRNDEIPFEGTGITLVQALGRVQGIQDQRANVRGVFLFRFEDPTVLGNELASTATRTPDGKIPVIYRIDMKDPSTLFISQSFPIHNGDVLYVSNAPLADIQKFVSIISSTIFPIASVRTAVQ